MTAHGPLRLREKICYSVGDLASNLYWNTFAVYLLFFYTDVFGIPAAAAGTLFLVARLFDGVIDPVVGMVADRTETRWGRFRPYLLWICVPFAVMGVLTFTTPHLAAEGRLVWAYATYVPLMILFTAFSIPYSAMLGVISPDPAERTNLASLKFIFAYTGCVIVSGSLLPMTRAFGGGNPARGWQLSFVTYGIAFVILIFFTFSFTRERVRPVPTAEGSMKHDLRDLMGNRPWIILALMTITVILGSTVRNTVTAHYFKYFVGSQSVSLPFAGGPRTFSFVELVSTYNATGQGAAILGVILLNWFVRPMGKKRALGILLAVSTMSNAVFCLLKPDQLAAMFSFNVLGSITGAPLFALLWSMYADAADYSEWKTGRRATGLVFSASIMGTKIGGALGAASAGWLLAGVGFQPNIAEPPEVLHGLVMLMSLIPAAIGFFSLVLVLFYPLNEKKLAEVEIDLRVRRASTLAAATGG